jgi:drug/metabolite transporter (DMT)-like permease
MSTYVYPLALITALTWGCGAVLSKRGFAVGGNPIQSSVTVVGVNVLIFWSTLLVWRGPSDSFTHISLPTIGLFALAGLFGNALGRFLTLYGIDQLGVTVNTAGINTRPLFAAAMAVLWLGESVQPLLLVGIVLVVVGVVTLAFSKGGDIRGWHAWQLWIPLGAAASFAIGNVLRRFGLTTTATAPLEGLTIDQTAAFIGLLIYAYSRRTRNMFSAPPRAYLFFMGSGVLGAIGHFCLFQALDRGPVAIVDPLVATQPLFATFLAYFLLGHLERITLQLAFGTMLIILGASIIVVI